MRAWFAEMPRPQRMLPQKRPAGALPLATGGGGGGGFGGGGAAGLQAAGVAGAPTGSVV